MPDWLLQLLPAMIGAAGGASGAYLAIRTDLADLKARVVNVEKSTDRAHERIDDGLQDRRRRDER